MQKGRSESSGLFVLFAARTMSNPERRHLSTVIAASLRSSQ